VTEPPAVMTIGEAARRLGLSEDTVRRRCDEGALTVSWTRPPRSGQRRVTVESVERMYHEMYGPTPES
jgi:excisionase family DNA binding protein